MNKLFYTLIISAGMLCGCKPSHEVYKINQEFKITLEKEGMGGYVWQMKPDSLITVIKEYNEAYLNDTTKLNEYRKTFELKGIKKGITELEFIKKRSFEPDSLVPKENHFIKKIEIK